MRQVVSSSCLARLKTPRKGLSENLNLSSVTKEIHIGWRDVDTEDKKIFARISWKEFVGRRIHSSMVHPRRIWVTSREPSGYEKTRSSTPRHIKDVNARLSFFLSLLLLLSLFVWSSGSVQISPTNIPRLACSFPSPFPIKFKISNLIRTNLW